VTPGNVNRTHQSPKPSDAIKVVYVDPSLELVRVSGGQQSPRMAASLTMPVTTLPAPGDPAVGITPGDVMLLLQNANGSAVGVVTSVGGFTITFGRDPLNVNQLNAPSATSEPWLPQAVIP